MAASCGQSPVITSCFMFSALYVLTLIGLTLQHETTGHLHRETFSKTATKFTNGSPTNTRCTRNRNFSGLSNARYLRPEK